MTAVERTAAEERELELEALVADVSEEELRSLLAAAEGIGAAGDVALYLEALERMHARREDADVERRLVAREDRA